MANVIFYKAVEVKAKQNGTYVQPDQIQLELERSGLDGWELFSILENSRVQMGTPNSTTLLTSVTLIFKRGS